MMNKQATSPVKYYTGRSRDMPMSIHWYNTRTQPKANVSIQKSYSHQPNIYPQTCNSLMNPATGAEMDYRDLIKNSTTKIFWFQSMANEFRQLGKGVETRMKTGTETI